LRPALLRFLLLFLTVAAGPSAAADSGATLVIPTRLVAGMPATLAALDAEGRLLPGAKVEFSGGMELTTDETGRATFTAPEQPGVITIRLTGDAPHTTTVVLPADHPPDELILDDVPGLVTLGTRFRVGGYGFRGEADANSVHLGNGAAVILAASPMELLLTPGPGAEPGGAELRVEAGGRRTEPVSLTLVKLELSADKASLAPKEKGKLTVRVLGAYTRLELEARNATPEVVRMRKGNVQRLLTSGGESNTATLELEGRNAGNFSISVRLVPRPAGLPDTDSALRHLLQAVRLAPNDDLRQRLGRQAHRLERHPQDAPRVRNELERILSAHSAGEFGRAVEAAWKALLKR